MGIDKIDRSLPPDPDNPGKKLKAKYLGQATSEGDLHLIGLCTSPIRCSRLNGYVVIVEDAKDTENITYIWKVEEFEENVSDNSISIKRSTPEFTTYKTGRVHWRPWKKDDNYKVRVTVTVVRDSTKTKLSLDQEVHKTEEDIEKLNRVNDRMVPGGNIEVLRRLYYELWPYIEKYSGVSDVPQLTKRLLGSIIYTFLSGKSGSTKAAESLWMQTIAVKIGGFREMACNREDALFQPFHERGVCRINPKVAAYHLGLLDLEKITQRSLHQSYTLLGEEHKRDIENLLRFPKANIKFSTQLFKKSLDDYFDTTKNTIGSIDEELTEADEIELYGSLFMRGTQLIPLSDREMKFGKHCERAYRLPIMTTTLAPDNNDKYLEDLRSQWNKSYTNNIKKHFHGFVHYAYLAPSYNAGKYPIKDLANWANKHIIEVIFSPYSDTKKIAVHKNLKNRLEEVQDGLNGNRASKISKMCGFVPRKIKRDYDSSLSNHAFGMAVDLDAPSNPQLKKEHLKAMEQLFPVGKLYGNKPKNTKDAFEQMKNLNNKFMDWAKGVFTPIFDDELEVSLYYPFISTDVMLDFVTWRFAGGIMTLPEELVNKMVDSGFQWGGNWKLQRDSMHFEIEEEDPRE